MIELSGWQFFGFLILVANIVMSLINSIQDEDARIAWIVSGCGWTVALINSYLRFC